MFESVLAGAGAAAVVFALLSLFCRSLYGSAMCLLGVLLQVAFLFFIVGAQTLGLMQVLVYAGAILVLIAVAIMSSSPRLQRLWASYPVSPALAAAVLGVLLVEGICVASVSAGTSPSLPLSSMRAIERAMAGLLFGRFALLTEAVGLLILIASLAVLPLIGEAKEEPESVPGERK